MSPDKYGFNTFLFLVYSLQRWMIIIIERMCFGILCNLSYSVFSFRSHTLAIGACSISLCIWRKIVFDLCIWLIKLINCIKVKYKLMDLIQVINNLKKTYNYAFSLLHIYRITKTWSYWSNVKYWKCIYLQETNTQHTSTWTESKSLRSLKAILNC